MKWKLSVGSDSIFGSADVQTWDLLSLCQGSWGNVWFLIQNIWSVMKLVVSVQVGETSVVNVDCSRAGPGQLSLEAALDSPPSSPTGSAPGSGNTTPCCVAALSVSLIILFPSVFPCFLHRIVMLTFSSCQHKQLTFCTFTVVSSATVKK